MKCGRCNGNGWVWWTELDHYSGPAVDGGADDTRYTCPICSGTGDSAEPERCPNTGDMFEQEVDDE